MLKYVMLILVVLSIGCDNMSKKMMDTVLDTEPEVQSEMPLVVEDTPAESPFDKPYVAPGQEKNFEAPTDFEFAMKRFKVKSITRYTAASNPKRNGIPYIEPHETLTIDYFNATDGTITERTPRSRPHNLYILAPNTETLDGYGYMPHFDKNGNASLLEEDEIEVIQTNFGGLGHVNSTYFRIIRNITRPEVDYSAFWQ
ncbi:MAG: hypothetical protein OXM61_16735 [Candidatus Poribacteria bacterium]|nr:hypothetical protein [Candidatus Poribacteria bacterium]